MGRQRPLGSPASWWYRCILPYSDEYGGYLYQLKLAVSSILGLWLHHSREDFHQPPEFPCLKTLLAYLELSMPGSDLEHRAHLLLAQLGPPEPTEVESDAQAPKQALETP
ncbi:ral guanine nucleotide dissociation stimulator-like [Lagenorhynchus albirostris]|uniref:ral guanine nucleotide dissociation stimulator-like n=1 Tax=Lagenorhynchus albirostris TaxID=27610 RepID=UPI0028E1F4E7|nr:ral guanine nucleotide dissociation stimulator-like [Lagenorhynchus albirostris]